jgi:hypothetical protein
MKTDTKIPKEKEMLDNLGKIAYTLDKSYLSRLENDYSVLPFDEEYNKAETVAFPSNIRALEIKRWVYDKDEKVVDCFKNVVSVVPGSEDTLALVVHRTSKGARMFFVIKNIGAGRNEDSNNNIGLLNDSLCGNFPGTQTSVFSARETDLEKLFNFTAFRSIATFCNVPSEKSEGYISQGIDKLLNGIVPKSDAESYYVIIVAESLSQNKLREVLRGYQELATSITPYAGYQFQAGENAAEIEGEMESLAHSEGISHSINKTHSVKIGLGVNASAGTPGVGGVGGGLTGGYGYGWGTSDTTSSGNTKTKGTNHSTSRGTSKNTTYAYKWYLVTDLIEKLEATIKRINESQSTGLWRCASYILAQEPKMSKNIAGFLRSVTQGDDSYIETTFINEWSQQESNEVTDFAESIKYLRYFCHPVFVNKKDETPITPTTNISATELANVFAFPRYSVQGLPVIQSARFGREPHSLDKLYQDEADAVDLGCAYHMYTEQTNHVRLSKEELTKHTFITGSTGSGKSNTIYNLLSNICLSDGCKTTFLVIEPAKGEYKDVFGGRKDVTVYGTNHYKAPKLLQINPFEFPEGIHVLEHIDRLVEVFNACWPMYAAMPAILKEAVEKSYEQVGWNLRTSKYINTFPTFDDLMTILPKVIESSPFSADTSSDYKGALLTRVRSLTTGIYGQIFGENIDNEILFDKNVIIDISRIGSSETKALIMGIMVLKLQEFRMSKTTEFNSNLRHITILEEAHNLLRRTSTEQTQESSNLQGKSVEMLANAISEMRTYGEGFVIADQSPGLMDMSVIRNTNTKIIHRLPDESDRILVGKAAGLSDVQIEELSRLERGVAAITQSGWLEPVLCLVDEFKDATPLIIPSGKEMFEWCDDAQTAIQIFLNVAFDIEQKKITRDNMDKIRKWRDSHGIDKTTVPLISKVVNGNGLSIIEMQKLAYDLFGGSRLGYILKNNEPSKNAIEIRKAFAERYLLEPNSKLVIQVCKLITEYLHSQERFSYFASLLPIDAIEEGRIL